jgi:uncharacterized spore protein YtfJ
VGFLDVGNGTVKMLPAQPVTMADRMVELLPQVVEDVKSIFHSDERIREGKPKHIHANQGNGSNREDRQDGPGLNQMGRGAPASYDDRMS